jgi:hypothetical protein
MIQFIRECFNILPLDFFEKYRHFPDYSGKNVGDYQEYMSNKKSILNAEIEDYLLADFIICHIPLGNVTFLCGGAGIGTNSFSLSN